MKDYNKLIELYDEWFENKEFWFSKNEKIDRYLLNKYIHFYKFLKYIYITSCEKKLLISCVLLLDQIPRHCKRVYDKNIDVKKYSKIAIHFSEKILDCFDDFKIEELCFIYLPYRHINNIENIYEIINIFLNLYNKSQGNDRIICKKYIYNTINNIYKVINKKNYINNLKVKDWQHINKDIFDKNSLKYNKNIIKNEETNIYLTIEKQLINIKDNSTIIISLSGGVDSMVALYIIYLLSKTNTNKIINIIAIHINYNNHETSNDELDFVNYYCNIFNIKLIYRTIYEINRSQCLNNGLRNMYEDITKKIRFDMYKYGYLHTKNLYVLLGHNKDDCLENIITNISNKNNYDNLSGMEYLTNIDNINIWRPMLDISKKEIIKFANSNNIPYLIDSTPKWSMRGKIRDNLKPVLYDLKNNNSVIDSLFDLKDYLITSNQIINEIIIDNLFNKLKKNNNNYSGIYNKNELLSLKYINISILFFKKINIKISFKTIKEFTNYITNFKRKKIILNKNNSINICNFNKDYVMSIIYN